MPPQKAEVILSNKTKILSILKTHHPIKTVNYQYGLSLNLRKDWNLIVFEWGDRRRVRQYTKRTNNPYMWNCQKCFRLLTVKKLDVYIALYFVNGIVFTPDKHDCQPVDYLLVMQYQKFLEEGDTAKAYRMIHTINFTYGEYCFANVVNVLDPSLASTKEITADDNKITSEALTNSKRKIIHDDDISDDGIPVRKKSKLPKTTFESSATTSIFSFQKPSISKLKEICTKLNVKYRNKGGRLWNKFEFNQIDTVLESSNIGIHFFKTQNVYKILSKFFTGNTNQYEKIKTSIIGAFRENMVSSGELSTKMFNKLYLNTITDGHFDFISKFLSCRIIIFDYENGIRKYGKWKNPESKRLTLVISFYKGLYSIVLSL